MSAPAEEPAHYQLEYSGLVRSELRALLRRADALNVGDAIRASIRAIDARLRVYPQFGEPLQDLATEGECIWIGTVAQVVVKYVIDEPRRLVFVVAPFKVLPGLGL